MAKSKIQTPGTILQLPVKILAGIVVYHLFYNLPIAFSQALSLSPSLNWEASIGEKRVLFALLGLVIVSNIWFFRALSQLKGGKSLMGSYLRLNFLGYQENFHLGPWLKTTIFGEIAALLLGNQWVLATVFTLFVIILWFRNHSKSGS